MSKRGKLLVNIIINIVLVCAIVITLYVAFYSFCYFSTFVKGASMTPTYNLNGGEDRILASKISGYERGDIVIIHTTELNTQGEEIDIIKRVIALGGDSVDMKMAGEELEIYVNGVKLDESGYLPETKYSIPPATLIYFEALKTTWEGEMNEQGIIIPQGQVFVLGDNRNASLDSSKHGPYLEKNVVAKVLCKIDKNAFAPLELLKYYI